MSYVKVKDGETAKLLDDNFLKYNDFSYGSYTGQERKLREYAIEELGVDKVAKMSDTAIEDYYKSQGLVPMIVNYDNCADYEMIYLVPVKELDKFRALSR